ncbi:MAG: amidohydrolase family protein [Firmicutes bacterium]|nr:amidohydrolase family protein [Bacillota bacterium]
MKREVVQELLLDAVKEAPVFNTHEHIIPQAEAQRTIRDLWSLLKICYVRLDMVSAGMSPSLWEGDYGWEEAAPYLPAVAYTGYYRMLQGALEDLFGIPSGPWTRSTWEELSVALARANADPNWYELVLKEKANYEVSILDQYWSPGGDDFDPRYFRPTLRVDVFLNGYDVNLVDRHGNCLAEMAKGWSVSLESFDDLLAMFDLAFQRTVDQGGLCAKLAMAYERDLTFSPVSRNRAAEIFGKASPSPQEIRDFQDFMFYETITRCQRFGLPLQIHTGMLARNQHSLAHTNPVQLNSLFLDYPDVKFILFHTGYPYWREGAILAKMLPNVYYDLCWLPVISPAAADRAFDEILDLVPANKLMWGGDGHSVEESYGALLAMRKVLTKALARKVAAGELSFSSALELMQGILSQNARCLFLK